MTTGAAVKLIVSVADPALLVTVTDTTKLPSSISSITNSHDPAGTVYGDPLRVIVQVGAGSGTPVRVAVSVTLSPSVTAPAGARARLTVGATAGGAMTAVQPSP